MNKKILLYYKYVFIKTPNEIKKWQSELCQKLDLKGRIIIATEGINGTLDGTPENTQKYIDAMNEHELFGGIDFKESVVPAEHEYFTRLRIVVKDEIVRLEQDKQKVIHTKGGKHLTPDQTHELLENKPENLVVLDGRNYYEAKVGKFKGAITPEIDMFRDFPKYIDQHLDEFKDKQVLMYCTGGIRCERASAYLKEKNVAKEVYQIEGGIHRYVEKYPEGHFRGKNYVFDGRITVKVNDDIIGKCDLCAEACDEYTNCCNASCNKHFIGCAPCIEKFKNACSQECLMLVSNGKVKARPLRQRVAI